MFFLPRLLFTDSFLCIYRYLVVIDDIWDVSVWEVIKCALPENDIGFAVITTTRNVDVADRVGGAYKLKALRITRGNYCTEEYLVMKTTTMLKTWENALSRSWPKYLIEY
jgi:hypothetical protein